MKRFLPFSLLMLGCALQFSCTQLQQEQKQNEKKEDTAAEIPPPLYLGSVHQVFTNDKFALLRIIGPLPPEGTVLITHPANGSTERVGNLIVSSAQHARNNIIAADIRAGVVAKGDRVFKYRSITQEEEQEEEVPAPTTLSGEELDLGYVPDGLRHLMERNTLQDTPEEEPQDSSPAADSGSVDDADSSQEESTPSPGIPSNQGLPKFDDIPDDISGWDSM